VDAYMSALSESEQRYRTVISTTAEGFWRFDRTETTIEVNDAMCQMLGYDRDEMLGTTPLDFVDEDNRRIITAQVDIAAATQQRCYEMTFKEKSGADVPVRVAATSLWTDSGQYAGTFAFITDISEEKRARAQLIQTAKLATLGEMATGVAHELNQPLNVIHMAAESALEQVEDGRLEGDFLVRKLQRIAAQSERAAAIIDHMRIFGRRAEEEPQPFDPREVAVDALRLMGEQLRLAEIAVSVDVSKPCPKVLGHAVLLEQVLINVLNNARDAIAAAPRSAHAEARKSRREIKLEVEGDAVSGVAKIMVGDSGGGIPKDVIERIFEPYFTTKEIGKGTGLGLSVSYGIIRDCGGTLEAANVDDGARITISLPAIEVEAGAERPPAGCACR